MNTNRTNQYSESDDTNAGGAELFFLFLFESGTAGFCAHFYLAIRRL